MIDWLLGGPLGADGVLSWGSSPSVIAGAGLVAGLAWVLAVWTSRRRWAEGGLWGLALLVLVVALAQPRWVVDAGVPAAGRTVVLVDGSASMGIREGGRARSDAVAAILARVGQTDGPVDLYHFDEDLHSGAPTDYVGRGSDLGLALSSVADRYLGEDLRAVVVITDGIDRGALRAQVQAATEDGTLDPSVVPALPGPVSFYQVGGDVVPQDVAITDVDSGGFAFLRTPITLTAHVHGAPGARVPVTLSREGSLVARRSATLDEHGEGEVSFPVTPMHVGRHAWEFSTPVGPQDAVPGNNSYPVVIRVVRDHTRVLQVCGSPAYDEKFLRRFLKEDPSVDLVSFFILRTNDDMGAGWRTDELSLISFPYERLFSEDLDSFDLVIFQNFDYAPYFVWDAPSLLGNVADWVRAGGALVMTGGDRSFDLGRYGTTPLASVLPVKLGVTGAKADATPFPPTLTPAGAAHPITRLVADVPEDRATWQSLPPQDGLNLVAGRAPGAAVLLEHPTLHAADGKPAPVLAVREVGAGRSMALMTDASWRWSFSQAAEGRGNQAYLRFWKNAMRWLVADPEDRRVVVSPSRENVLVGDPVRVVVQVRDTGYQPLEGVWVKGTVEGPGGDVGTFQVQTDAAGQGSVTLTPDQRGAHRVKVQAGEARGDRAETVFAVSARDPELVEITPDSAYLQTLARLYSGAWRGPGDDAAPLVNEAATRTVGARSQTELGTIPLVGLLFGLLASLAWWVRRRAGAA